MNKINKFEEAEREHEPTLPSNLDVIKVVDRWGQIIATRCSSLTVKFLVENQLCDVVLDDYKIIKPWHSVTIERAREMGADIAEQDIKNVRWGPEEEQHPELKGQVRVFGEYAKVN